MNEQAMKDVLAQILSCVLNEVAAQAGHTCSAPENGPIPVELSARHVHLSEKDAIALFGAPLTHARDLSQPGQFLCKERVRIIGPKGVMDNVAILGPSRGKSQVEISKTDARALGVDAPVRQSGDVAGSPGIILASDHGIVGLEEGVIVASRHIHMTPADAARFGVADNDMVSVRLGTERPVVFEDVLVRVSDKFSLAMHIDADEGNGSGWKKGVDGVIVGKSGCCHGH
ncbi:phosphate propanoyltransferase [Mailhella massiliensis]|uniref:Phosphate propanoyltransferase n=1 Tax=Mailhella massiliensis TaxID=1903261 RepID=A0A921DQE6_9BACT|nr:phosphate propanoyltransferase [Mailhella massiliensis]HJD96440.1 phosphate propanoyltransferase [Mailhella massiliensis]